jgi:hypothetical protein
MTAEGHAMIRALRARWLGCLLAFLPVGCIPGIAWLPDSSGFVYTAGQSTSQLRHFDVAKGADRLLVEDTQTATLLPAVSPDSKRVAVARIVRDKGVPDSLQLIFYDLTGKETGRSKVLRSVRRQNVDKEELVACYLYWDQRGDRILVSDIISQTSIYDAKNDRFKVVEDAFACAFGGMPFRPDGKGFLVAKSGKDRALRFVFVEWDGAERPIAMAAKLLDDDEDYVKREMLCLPWLCDSSWNANVARVRRGAVGFQLDTANLKGMPYAVPPAEASIDGAIVAQNHQFPGSGLNLRLLETPKMASRDPDNRQRIVAIDARTGKTTVVMDKLAFCALFPSPDKKRVVAHCSIKDVNGQQEQQFFLVIDQAGKIIGQKSLKE